MFFKRKEWMEWISYGVVGMFSLAMFVFGLMFPEYTFVNECYDVEETVELTEKQREGLWELLDEENTGFIINSVHNAGGCYSYTKRIKGGASEIELSVEEEKALQHAIKNER